MNATRVRQLGLRGLVGISAALLCAAGLAWAGNTGKIAGKVHDRETGEPIANVSIVEQKSKRFGAASNEDGDFFILNVPPGIYDIEISCQGYHTVVVQGMEINVDITAPLKVELAREAVQLKSVEIKYQAPVVKLGVSTKEQRFDKKTLEIIRPEDVGQLLTSTTGFKMDQEGNWHVRGSRAGDVAFIVDGVDYRDPLVNTPTHFNMSNENTEEVQVLTGGFNAEYGRVMGAVVQVTTSEGSPTDYSGRVEYQTDRVMDSYSFNTDRAEISFGGPVPYSRELLNKPMTFYFSGITRLTNTYTPFALNRSANDYMGIGIKLPERQDNSYQTSLKLAYPLSDTKKLTLNTTSSYSLWDIYPRGEGNIDGNYGYGYKYDLANRPWAENRQFSGTLTYTNQLSSKSFYELKFITLRMHSIVSPRGKSPGDFTLLKDVEDNATYPIDQNLNGWLDPGEYVDSDGDGFMDGFVDANRNSIFDGGGEGYEDLNYNGRWDRGEDWVDLNGNGIYDAAEPWIDVVNPLTGENNIGVWDPWDSYSDVNKNGRWDPSEPQLVEQDWNHDGHWNGERFVDANDNGQYDAWEPWQDLNGNYLWDSGEPFTDVNGNGKFDYSEGFDDKNQNGKIDKRNLQARIDNPDTDEPFIDGDFWWDTGEPFIDEPNPVTGEYNGKWDKGEIWFDLPSSALSSVGAGFYFIGTERTLNGQYDGPNYFFDEYELFTQPAGWGYGNDPSRPVLYTYDEEARGTDWPSDIFHFIPGRSTWTNRTLNDTADPVFDLRNFQWDADKEWFQDYNNNGKQDSDDGFLNSGLWDPTAFWQDRISTEYTVKFDIQSQVSKFHELKSGVELKYRDLQMQSIERPDLPYTGEAVLPAGSPWPDRGGIRDFYKYRPWEGDAYLQDKMEFEGLIVNAGLRMDFIIHDQKVVDEFRERLLRDEPGAILAERGKWRISPRLGISHPITEKSKLYFNYGHFYQAPQFQYFYRSATANFESNSTIGNPNLDYEKTVQYELGVNTQVSEWVVFDIAGYYKDQYGLISTSDERWKNLTLDRYVNLDYGRMRGFEFSIEKRPANHYALQFNYDFSYAFGKASDQHANREARLKNVPYNWDEHPLNWDETHKINAYVTVLFNKGDHPEIAGLTLPDDWMATVQWEFGSGLPYTPGKYLVGIANENLILPNSARLPWHERTTLKFEKYYTLGDERRGNKLLFGFTVDDLFNRQNVQAVYAATGTPDKSQHPADPKYNPYQNRTEYDTNPRNWEPGRNVLFRVGMTF